MKTISVYLLTAVTLIAMLSACGPSEEERQRREQARQDSLEQVRQQQLQQQRMDSIARAKKQARADSLAKVRKEEEQASQIQFNSNGSLAVQVEAWRSRDKAQNQVSKWKERGFPNAYVVKHGNEDTGNIWFRVRLGRVSTMEMARRLGQQLQEKYDEPHWIAEVQDEGSMSDSDSAE